MSRDVGDGVDEDLMVVSWELLGNGGDVPWFVVDVDPVYAS